MNTALLKTSNASGLWQPYEPSAESPWDLQRVVHLHRRAGFAATWSEIERDLEDGPQAAVSRLLEGRSRLQGVPDDFDRLADVIGDSAVASASPSRLKAWWVYRMLFGPVPLAERLALMWHSHFATSNLKVDSLAAMRRQNDLFRQHARAPFAELLTAVMHDPALLDWLDASSNRKGQPNENLARESMELFTLGIGRYSEADVKQAARALTGWSTKTGSFRLDERFHDDGQKTILGHSGAFDGDAFVQILLEHPATAQRLTWRIGRELLGETAVTAADLAELAAGMRERDLDVGWAVETVLRSRASLLRGKPRYVHFGPGAVCGGRCARFGNVRRAAQYITAGRMERAIGAGPVLPAERRRVDGRPRLALSADRHRADEFRVGADRRRPHSYHHSRWTRSRWHASTAA